MLNGFREVCFKSAWLGRSSLLSDCLEIAISNSERIVIATSDTVGQGVGKKFRTRRDDVRFVGRQGARKRIP